MNNKTLNIILSVVALAAVTGWIHADRAQRAAHARVIAAELEPMAALVKVNKVLIDQLNGEPFTEKDLGILEAYLTKIRRDGVPKNVEMKQRLDQLAENTTAIVTLIKVYAPNAVTAGFSAEADKYRNYASAWRDRWNSVMELFMAGGNYAAAGVPYPAGFAAAVDAEIAAAK